MRFFVFIVLIALALSTAAPVAGAGPQPTSQNATATTTTPAASMSPAPTTSSSSATPTPADPLGDVLEKDPRNATLGDVQTVAEYLADQGADRGGEGSARTEAFDKGETATVEIPTERVGGKVGVVISTDKTPIYGYLIEDGGGGLDILTVLTSLQAWFAGAGIAFVWMVIAGWNVLRGEDGRLEVA